MAKTKSVLIGDVIQISTANGLAYAQFSHEHKRYGALIRVLPGIYEAKPFDLAKIVEQAEVFVTFVPLKAAVKRGIFEVVANIPIPDFANAFPLFRTGVVDPVAGKVKTWWLWDGKKEWKVGEISPEQRKLPIRGIWNDTLLIEKIESGWSPAKDPF